MDLERNTIRIKMLLKQIKTQSDDIIKVTNRIEKLNKRTNNKNKTTLAWNTFRGVKIQREKKVQLKFLWKKSVYFAFCRIIKVQQSQRPIIKKCHVKSYSNRNTQPKTHWTTSKKKSKIKLEQTYIKLIAMGVLSSWCRFFNKPTKKKTRKNV